MNEDRTELRCPECNHDRFDWETRRVERGTVYRRERRGGDLDHVPDATRTVDLIERDAEENGVVCSSCQSMHALDDLVPEGG